MEQPRISFSRGKGKLRHNNRDMISNNVDRDRIKDNITFVKMPVRAAYEKIFGQAQHEYNARQTRKSRKIDNYFDKLFPDQPNADDLIVHNNNKQQSYYEWVIGIGDMRNLGYEANPEGAKTAENILIEYMSEFQKRNPNFFVFNAVMHRDEATPHIHFDVIPFADGYKTGMTRQQGIAKALEALGYGSGKNAIAEFTKKERQIFREICEKHGIDPAIEEKGRGFTMGSDAIKEFKEQQYEIIEEVKEEKAQLQDDVAKIKEEKAKEIKEKNKIKEEKIKLQDDLSNLQEKIDLLQADKVLKNFDVPPRPKEEQEISEEQWKASHPQGNYKRTLFKSSEQLQHEAYQKYVADLKNKNEEIRQKQDNWDEKFNPIQCAKETLKIKDMALELYRNLKDEIRKKAKEMQTKRERDAINAKIKAEKERDAAIKALEFAKKSSYDKAKNEYEDYIEAYEEYTGIKRKNIEDERDEKLGYNHSRGGMCR